MIIKYILYLYLLIILQIPPQDVCFIQEPLVSRWEAVEVDQDQESLYLQVKLPCLSLQEREPMINNVKLTLYPEEELLWRGSSIGLLFIQCLDWTLTWWISWSVMEIFPGQAQPLPYHPPPCSR